MSRPVQLSIDTVLRKKKGIKKILAGVTIVVAVVDAMQR
jgi:hypothetical protein